MSRPVVYPVRTGRRPDPDHLRWSIRSVAANLPHSEIVIVGVLPDWVDPETVTHIPTVQGRRKFENIGVNLHAALDVFRGETIHWFNDDFYVLSPVTEVPLIDRGPMGPFCQSLRKHKAAGSYSTDHDDYLRGMEGQRQILRSWGFDDDTPCVDLHVPIPVDVDRCVDILERTTAANPGHPHGHFRMLYGAGLPSVRSKDVKYSSKSKRIDNWPSPFISTFLAVWQRGVAGAQLRERFPTPSPYEKEST